MEVEACVPLAFTFCAAFSVCMTTSRAKNDKEERYRTYLSFGNAEICRKRCVAFF
ncbi:hypothetical protein [Treponema endosymbiont of Eucomonympha sp.]|uniref:hypothetical protein n=1 Tax=Treponema endosymbiont of Eucomonympha sp. TaxID=1580831 RepID=UPI00164F09F7|nr:hypothetical protein [Treponema endosymbiont of Eucomonympha sp.]